MIKNSILVSFARVLMLVALVVTTGSVYSAPGDLDPSFGQAGMVMGTQYLSVANDLLVQADGKIVVAGDGLTGFGLARYNSDGGLDTSFGTNGAVTTSVSSVGVAQVIALQADGKIVAAGFARFNTFSRFAIVRYNANGGVDTSFGSDGLVITSVGSIDDTCEVRGVALQPDGKIVVTGFVQHFYAVDGVDIAVVRYNADGSLDTGFGSQGVVVTDLGIYSIANDVGITPDGKIIVVGTANADFAVVRYLSDGRLDASFGENGAVVMDLGGRGDEARALALDSLGRLVVVGSSGGLDFPYVTDFTIHRFDSAGRHDASFGQNGRVDLDFQGGSDVAYDVAIQENSKIVVVGGRGSSCGSDFLLARLNADGSRDVTFGADGVVTTDFGRTGDYGYAIAIQPDGKIVAAGEMQEYSNNSGSGCTYFQHFALARYIGDPDNIAPTASDVSVVGSRPVIAWIPLVADADSGPQPISCRIATQPQNGSATVAADCSSGVYKPDHGFIGIDRFTYTASDGLSESSPGSVTIAVTEPGDNEACRNQFPVSQFTQTGKEGTLTITLTGNITTHTNKVVKVCPGTTLKYTATSTKGPVVCQVKNNTTRGSGSLKINDHIKCTDKPAGKDKVHFKVKSGVSK